MRVFYQLWCYYETKDDWVMEGLFKTEDEARVSLFALRDEVETPSMPDWAVVKVEGWW